MPSHADKGAILENLKELGLDVQIETSDLVQEERPLVRLFHAAELSAHRPSEGSFFIAE